MLGILAVPALIAYGPMLWTHAGHLFAKEHFQFFPVFLLAVLFTCRQRFQQEEAPPPESWRIEPVSMGVGLVAIAAAWVIQSPWLTAVSALMVGNSALAYFPSTRQAWRLLVLLIPLPLNLDQLLVQRLQSVSSQLASRTLDVLDVPHLMQGNVLELGGRHLFVEEACSGINSVYLLLAAALYFVVLAKARFIVGIPLVLSTIAWSVLANTARISVIAVAHDSWQTDLASGLAHDVLGVATTGFTLLAIFSTYNLLQFAGKSISDRQIREPSSSSSNLTPTALWNTLTTTRLSLVYEKGQRGLMLAVVRWKLTLLMMVVFVGSFSSKWGLHAWAEWNNTTSAIESSIPRESLEARRRKLQTLQNDQWLRGLRQLKVTQQPLERSNAMLDFDALSWQVEGTGWKGRLIVAGPFHEWRPRGPYFPLDARQTEPAEIQPIPLLNNTEMIVTRTSGADGQRVTAYSAMFRHSGEVVTPRTTVTAHDVVARFQKTEHFDDREQKTLWHVELLTPQATSLNLPGRTEQETEVFGQLLQAILKRWDDPITDSASPNGGISL